MTSSRSPLLDGRSREVAQRLYFELADSVLAIADFPISRMTNDVLKALQADKKVREYIEERRAEANNLSDISEDMFAGPTGGARNSSRKFMKGTRKGR